MLKSDWYMLPTAEPSAQRVHNCGCIYMGNLYIRNFQQLLNIILTCIIIPLYFYLAAFYLGGGLDLDQLTVGYIAEFNMWSYKMAVEELNTETCGTNGNISSWYTLQEMGSSARTTELFSHCTGELTYQM